MEENVILIGSKYFGQYIQSIEYFFKKKNQKKVTLKARGKQIEKAINLAEKTKNDLFEDSRIIVENIKISTEKFEKEGFERSVSCISLDIVKK